MNEVTVRWISASAPDIGTRAGMRRVWQRRRMGRRPGANSTRARPVPRSDGSMPRICPEKGRRWVVSIACAAVVAALCGVGVGAGRGLPASFAAHICLTESRAIVWCRV